MIAAAVYILGIVVTLACAVLLLRGYRRGRKRLLLWTGVCFSGLAVTHLLRFVDLVIFPQVDLYMWRLAAGAISMAFMLYGLIWESR